MARALIVHLTDDLDGGEAAETVSFGWRGVDYEIDLSKENAEEMDRVLETWIRHSRRLGPTRTHPVAGSGRGEDRSRRRAGNLASLRAWARENGYPVSDRGRVSTEVKEAFDAAHP